eukprot:TRINITY_DN16728_c0_g1_i1.p1 TRINITY_DN16728_c0_g1~~TRINITY_DN16728_c0_g1_i1.p1  ORF type:complete len:467 (+),score=90.61 TRINITY_DN16728_c0_g1_i1:135-1535(+)
MKPPSSLRVSEAFCPTTSALRVLENVLRGGGDPEKREMIVRKLRSLLHEATTADAAVQATRPLLWEYTPEAEKKFELKAPPAPLPSLCQVYSGDLQAPPWVSSHKCACMSCGQPMECSDKRCRSERGCAVMLSTECMEKLERGFLQAKAVQRARFRTRLRLLRCRIFLSRNDTLQQRLDYERHRLQLAALEEQMFELADTLSHHLPPPPPASTAVMTDATATKPLGKLGFSSYLQSIGSKRKGKALLQPLPTTPDNILNESTLGALRKGARSPEERREEPRSAAPEMPAPRRCDTVTTATSTADARDWEKAQTLSAIIPPPAPDAPTARLDSAAARTVLCNADEPWCGSVVEGVQPPRDGACVDQSDHSPPSLPSSLLSRRDLHSTAGPQGGSAIALPCATQRCVMGVNNLGGSLRRKMEFSTLQQLRGQRDELSRTLQKRIGGTQPPDAPVDAYMLVSDDAVSSW